MTNLIKQWLCRHKWDETDSGKKRETIASVDFGPVSKGDILIIPILKTICAKCKKEKI